MKAKNKRITTASIHHRLKAHMEATAEARQFATEGIALAKAGKLPAARAAARKADAAHLRMQQIEETTAHTFKHPAERE